MTAADWEALARRHIAELQAALAATKCGLLVPLYSYPGGSGLVAWDAVTAAGPKVPVIAIANPASGPGLTPNPAYTPAIQRAAGAGVKVIGYVATGFGGRPPSDVLADVDRWLSFYPEVRGIFFDQQPTDAGHEALYGGYFAHARQAFPGGLVVSNPGTACDRSYYDLGKPDILCLVETAGQSVRLPDWAVVAPDASFAALCYASSEAAMRAVVANLRTLGIGWVYVTDDSLPNPWDSVPSYFAAEVAAVAVA